MGKTSIWQYYKYISYLYSKRIDQRYDSRQSLFDAPEEIATVDTSGVDFFAPSIALATSGKPIITQSDCTFSELFSGDIGKEYRVPSGRLQLEFCVLTFVLQIQTAVARMCVTFQAEKPDLGA